MPCPVSQVKRFPNTGILETFYGSNANGGVCRRNLEKSAINVKFLFRTGINKPGWVVVMDFSHKFEGFPRPLTSRRLERVQKIRYNKPSRFVFLSLPVLNENFMCIADCSKFLRQTAPFALSPDINIRCAVCVTRSQSPTQQFQRHSSQSYCALKINRIPLRAKYTIVNDPLIGQPSRPIF